MAAVRGQWGGGICYLNISVYGILTEISSILTEWVVKWEGMGITFCYLGAEGFREDIEKRYFEGLWEERMGTGESSNEMEGHRP